MERPKLSAESFAFLFHSGIFYFVAQRDINISIELMKKLILIIFALVALEFYSCALTPLLASAEPPHPSKHYRWETYPNGNVILYFLENGQHVKYVYKMVHEVELATGCTHSYGDKDFQLITFDSSYPYWYTMSIKPIMRWDVNTKRFIKLVTKW